MAAGRKRCEASGKQFLLPDVQCCIFEHRACNLLDTCCKALEITQRTGKTASTAWNKHMMEIIAAARAYMDAVVLRDFVKQVESTLAVDPGVYAALSKLRALFALTTITHPQSYDAISFTAGQYLNDAQLTDIRNCIDSLLDELLPDAIALTDAWDFTDASLCSAIGQYDGNAYETLMAWTRQMPINQEMDEDGSACKYAWETWIKPALSPGPRERL
ncbi:hypothetical protein FQN49_004206 [Arthroderma sp. PD_2]|nr:hypothetical protein FQN49_004206 [Arthroderma sp. PD_2]